MLSRKPVLGHNPFNAGWPAAKGNIVCLGGFATSCNPILLTLTIRPQNLNFINQHNHATIRRMSLRKILSMLPLLLLAPFVGAQGKMSSEELSNLAWKHKDSNADSSYHYAQLALKASIAEKNVKVAAYSLSDIGNFHKRNGNYDLAVQYHLWSLEVRNVMGNSRDLASGHNLLGLTYKKMGEYGMAADCFRKGISLLTQPEDELMRANMMDGLAMAHLRLLQHDSAVHYLMLSVEILERLGARENLAQGYNNIGRTFLEMHSFEEALNYFERSALLFDSLGNPKGQGESLTNVGAALIQLHRPKQAIVTLQKAKEICLENGFTANLTSIDNNLAMAYQSEGDFGSALALQQALFAIARAKRARKDALLSALSIAEIQLRQQQFANGLAWTDTASALMTDTLDLVCLSRLAAVRSGLLGGLGDFEGAFRESEVFRITNDSMNKLLSESQALQARLLHAESQLRLESAEAQHREETLMLSRRLWKGATLALAVIFTLAFLWAMQRRRGNQIRERMDLEIRELILDTEEQMLTTRRETQNIERTRIAGAIHDSIGSALALVQMLLEGVRPHLSLLPDNTQQRYSKAMERLEATCDEVRVVASDLEQSLRSKLGLAEEVREMCEAISSSGRIQIQFLEASFPIDLDEQTQRTLLKVMKELLANTIRHSQATKATLQMIGSATEILITLEDNGKGMVSGNERRGGMGLRNLEKTAQMLGGSLAIDSSPGNGTHFTFRAPNPPNLP
jgi:signal transduction histidine kinase